MKKLVSLLILFTAFSVTAYAQRSVIKKLEQQWVQDINKHDSASLDKLLADNYVDNNWNGQVRHKKDMLEFNGFAKAQKNINQLTIKIQGDTAMVKGLKKINSNGGDMVRTEFTDIFLKENGEWKAVSSQEKKLRPVPKS